MLSILLHSHSFFIILRGFILLLLVVLYRSSRQHITMTGTAAAIEKKKAPSCPRQHVVVSGSASHLAWITSLLSSSSSSVY